MRIARAHRRESFSCEPGQPVSFRRPCRATDSRLKGNTMSNTYQICEVTVTLPSLGTITTDVSGNQIKHGDKCRVCLYAVQPDWRSGRTFEGFTVGWLTYEGYSESPFKRSQKIIMPEGYKLIALRVDERGIPTSLDSLPVQFVGGFISSLKDTRDIARVSIGKIDGGQRKIQFKADRFAIHKNAQAIINNANANYNVKVNLLQNRKQYAVGMGISVNPAATKWRLSDQMHEAIMNAVAESDLFKSLVSSVDAQAASIVGLQQAIQDEVNDAIRNALKPGGAVWCQIDNSHHKYK